VWKRLLDSAGILKSGFEQCQWIFKKNLLSGAGTTNGDPAEGIS
jgi:hypothetical protein